MPSVLRDLSDGRLHGWPGGYMIHPDGSREYGFRPEEAEDWPPTAIVLRGSAGRWADCKYCYRSVLPLRLHEHGFVAGYGCSEMIICAECGAGLTPPEPVEVCPDPEGRAFLEQPTPKLAR